MIDVTFQKNNRLLVIDDSQAIHADFRKILQGPDSASDELEATGAGLFGENRAPGQTHGL